MSLLTVLCYHRICLAAVLKDVIMSAKKRKKTNLPASHVLDETLGLHSVADESRRKIYNATCRALNQADKQADQHEWKELSETVFPDIFYPAELPAVVDGASIVFYMCNVRKCLQTVMQKCTNFAKLVHEKIDETPDIVFDLLCYNDEAIGGNILATQSGKKVSLWYFSLRQLGYLWSDCMWHPLCLLQHEQFDKIKGGFSCFARKVVQELRKQNLQGGFPVRIGETSTLMRLTLRFMLSDLDAIRYALDCKGSAGIRCCVFCKNCIKRDTQISDYNAYFKDITTTDFRLFHLQSDTEIFEVIDELATIAPSLSKSALQKKETAMGFNYNPHGLLSDRLAREALPPSAFLLDTMHLYFSNGIVSWEMNSMYNAWAQTGVGDLKGFLDLNWKTSLLMACNASTRKRLANEYMFTGNSYKGSASNLLAFFPLFEYFLSRVLTSRSLLEKEMACFKALRMITIELQKIQHCQGPLSVDRLQELQSIHQELLIKAWSSDFVKPKHHQRFHQAMQMKRLNFHCDAFASEKKHSIYKSHIGLHRFDPWTQDETGKYSKLVLRAIWQHHIPLLAASFFGTKLIGQSSPSPIVSNTLRKPNCRTSRRIQHLGKTLSENDVVLGARPGIILSAAQADEDFYVTLQPLQLEERTDFWSRWKIHGNIALLPISQVGTTPTWWLKLNETCWLCLH